MLVQIVFLVSVSVWFMLLILHLSHCLSSTVNIQLHIYSPQSQIPINKAKQRKLGWIKARWKVISALFPKRILGFEGAYPVN